MHTFLVAVIFTLFMLGMGVIIALATWTPRGHESEQDAGELPLPGAAA